MTGLWPAAALRQLADSLVFLNFRGNHLYGQIPDSISVMQALSVLHVDSNHFSGTLPASINQLLNLTKLTAASNQLKGGVPAGLSRLKKLSWLALDGNQLTGTVPTQLLVLPQLEHFDLQGNQLSGLLQEPAGMAVVAQRQAGVSQINKVLLGDNQIVGSLPSFLAALPVVVLDLSSNRLTGSLPASLGSNLVMQDLHLQGNKLSGSLPPALFGGNSLAIIDLSNNTITGHLPASVAQLSTLRQLSLASNHMAESSQLPPFLVVDSSVAGQVVEPSVSTALLCRPLSVVGNPHATVVMDPASYGYQGCYCLPPFDAVMQQGPAGANAVLTCVAQQQAIQGTTLANILGPLLAVIAVLLVALLGVAAALRCNWSSVVQLGAVAAEKKVPPGSTAKDVTLVLTDVQGSTELWEWDQQLASEAFKIHDRILRQYMTHFFGYEVSTEGDAFLVAFHEPFDAVAWCLCVQMALHNADWPQQLLMHKSTCLDTAETLELKRRQRQERWQQRMTHAAMNGAQDDAVGRRLSKASTGGGGVADAPADTATGGIDVNLWQSVLAGTGDALPPAPLVALDEHDSGPYGMTGGTSCMDTRLEDRMAEECAALAGGLVQEGQNRNVLFRGLRVRMSAATGGVDFVRLHSVTQRAEYVGDVLRKVQAVGETPQGGQVVVDSETFKGISSRLPELGGAVLEATQKLVRGYHGPTAQEIAAMFTNNLALDDAVVVQDLETGASNTRSNVDVGNRGQQQNTTLASSAHLLGSSSGAQITNQAGHPSTAPGRADSAEIEDGPWVGRSHAAGDLGRTGNFEQGIQQAAASEAARDKRRNGDGLVEMKTMRRRSSLSYGVMVIDMGVHQLSGLPNKVNLTQVMPCGLEDRARFFPRLDSLRQETPGYFDAPAAGLVPLCPSGNPSGTRIPSVTIVFCTIDKYGEMVDVNRSAAETALELYSDCMRWLLLVGGGYECQESEGTFMMAFSGADVAIEWCLMVQQVLRDMSWPPRGPRVKMGVYCGTPTQVIPHNTTGRADYFGPLGDRLMEFQAYFDEERRLWPWMFKRRSRWDQQLYGLGSVSAAPVAHPGSSRPASGGDLAALDSPLQHHTAFGRQQLAVLNETAEVASEAANRPSMPAWQRQHQQLRLQSRADIAVAVPAGSFLPAGVLPNTAGSRHYRRYSYSSDARYSAGLLPNALGLVAGAGAPRGANVSVMAARRPPSNLSAMSDLVPSAAARSVNSRRASNLGQPDAPRSRELPPALANGTGSHYAGGPQSSSTGGPSSRGSGQAAASVGTSSRQQRPPPVETLVYGLESQVLPGMLHSSNRLRLVSKRRRQMSYCYFQESCQPGVPADAADPRRLLPAGYSTLPHAPGLAPGSQGLTSPPSLYAGSEVGVGLGVMHTIAQSVGSRGTVSSGHSTRADGAADGGVASAGDDRPDASGLEGLGAAAGPGGSIPAGSAQGSFTCGWEGAGQAVAAATPAAAVVDDFCGLPAIEALPDAEVLESLRLAAPQRGRRPSSTSTVTGLDSVAGFEGPQIGHMCDDIMRGRWLWIRELLVHDLGQFKFKGVAGVHTIVSVTSEQLSGRTFPTTIRRGKGEQMRLGRGLLAIVQMLPRSKPPNYAPYAAQQMLQPSMLPYSEGGSQHGLPGGLSQVWSSTPLAHAATTSAAPASPDGGPAFAALAVGAGGDDGGGSCAGGPCHQVDTDDDQQQLVSSGAAAAPGTPGAEHSTSLRAEVGDGSLRHTLARAPGGAVSDQEVMSGGSNAGGAAMAGPPAATYLAAPAFRPGPSEAGVKLQAVAAKGLLSGHQPLPPPAGSSGNVAVVRKQYPVEPRVLCDPVSGLLLHYPSAPEFSAATASSDTAAGGFRLTLEQQLPPVPASLAAAGPFWQGVAAGRSGHRRRRHSVCTAQIAAKKRMGLAAKGMLFEEMQPFEEAEEWLQPRDSLDSSLTGARQPQGPQLGTDPSFSAMLVTPAGQMHPGRGALEDQDSDGRARRASSMALMPPPATGAAWRGSAPDSMRPSLPTADDGVAAGKEESSFALSIIEAAAACSDLLPDSLSFFSSLLAHHNSAAKELLQEEIRRRFIGNGLADKTSSCCCLLDKHPGVAAASSGVDLDVLLMPTGAGYSFMSSPGSSGNGNTGYDTQPQQRDHPAVYKDGPGSVLLVGGGLIIIVEVVLPMSPGCCTGSWRAAVLDRSGRSGRDDC
eukprot:gene2698-2998_t